MIQWRTRDGTVEATNDWRAFVHREDGRVEWVCPHGVGHTVGLRCGAWTRHTDTHGCDGCCQGKPWKALLTNPYQVLREEWKASGWAALILPLIDQAEQDHILVVQIKEKFGGLRFYVEGGSERLEEMIRQAEEQSEQTCEDCGKPGRLCTPNGSWIRTLCPECEQQAKRPKG